MKTLRPSNSCCFWCYCKTTQLLNYSIHISWGILDIRHKNKDINYMSLMIMITILLLKFDFIKPILIIIQLNSTYG